MSMQVTLYKEITIKTAIAYLILEKEVERKDIRDLLTRSIKQNIGVHERIVKYLKDIGVINVDGYLTDKGEEIRETGKMFVEEEGKYKIWYASDDDFLKTKVLYFERHKADFPKNRQFGPANRRFEPEAYCLPIDNKPFVQVKVKNDYSINGEVLDKTTEIDLYWIWNGLEQSFYSFSGQIERKKIADTFIVADKKIADYILKVFPRWNKTYSRLKCAFDDLTNKQKDTFLLEGKYNDRCGFSIINFKDIPIMPNGLEDAEKWRNWHINKEIEQHYYLENDFNTLINKTNNKEAFEAYKKRLTEPTIHQYRSELRQDGRNKQTKSYWHLVAANDLNPAETYKVIEKSLNYKIGQNISFEEITNQLKSNTQHAINCVYYYDKYTNSKEQQQKMKAFFDAFDCKVKILITQKGKTRDKYLQENVPEIITKDVKVVFLKDKPQHNRYIILSESNKKYTIWQLPSSIDFIKFYQTEDVTSSSKGRIVDSMSYHQVAKEMLKPDLITFIER